MTVNVLVDTFTGIGLGREANSYLQLTRVEDENIWNLRQVTAPQVLNDPLADAWIADSGNRELISLSGRLGALINDNHINFVLQRRDEEGQSVVLHEGDADLILEKLKNLNEKIQRVRNSFCTPCQFTQTLFNKLPTILSGRVRLYNDLDEDPIKEEAEISRHLNENSSPLVSHYLNDLGKTYVDASRPKWHSICSRIQCFVLAIIFSLATIISPFTVAWDLYRNRNSFHWENKGVMARDIVFGIIIKPFAYAAISMKFLAASIFHSGIIYGQR